MERLPTILAVDDEPDLRLLMERILSRRGYSVTTAGGLKEALAELDAMPVRPDLLIVDIVMPDGRGLDLADQARQRVDGLNVLFVSGYSRSRAKAEGLIDDDSPLLEKPFDPRQLADAAAAAMVAPSAG